MVASKFFKKFFIYLLVLLFVQVSLAEAHGFGKTLTIDSDGYQIDIDIDTENPKSGQTVRFDFDLLDLEDKGLNTDFDYIWVRIQKGQKIIFAGGIGKPDFGPTGFTTALADSGLHIISARFQRDGQKVVEGQTNFEIAADDGSNSSNSFFTFESFLLLLIGLVAGFFSYSFVNKR